MIGEVLRKIRIFHDVTLTELAKDFKISQGYLSDIELGKKEPTLEILNLYSKHFEIPLSAILFYYENQNTPETIKKFKRFVGSALIKIIEQ